MSQSNGCFRSTDEEKAQAALFPLQYAVLPGATAASSRLASPVHPRQGGGAYSSRPQRTERSVTG